MNEEALNTSVRKFLRKFGVMAQRELETAVRAADAKGQLKDNDPLPVKAVVSVGGIDLKFEIDGDIELAGSGSGSEQRTIAQEKFGETIRYDAANSRRRGSQSIAVVL